MRLGQLDKDSHVQGHRAPSQLPPNIKGVRAKQGQRSAIHSTLIPSTLWKEGI